MDYHNIIICCNSVHLSQMYSKFPFFPKICLSLSLFYIGLLRSSAKKKLKVFLELIVRKSLHQEQDNSISVEPMCGRLLCVSSRDPSLQKAVRCFMSHLQAMNMIQRKMLLTLGGQGGSFSVYWWRPSFRTVVLLKVIGFHSQTN